ncbi:hypothetical protein LTS08_001869 [Lithohypha guttulata]|uniref:uncharacterized protein n=1 Tax=Lithohypha guttulata TaxID=1690604 RepID=UPI002DE0A416|nr:hypothetical protein LTR51_003447 [Lithohypha guttulata]KAK5105592.1 hypothetical protein LTS08_001869 [Lithohypha guttulata]
MQHTSLLPKPDPWTVEAVVKDLPSNTSDLTAKSSSSSPVQFFHYVERLKIEKREGWRRFGISRGESIADHMYRMSIITMLAPPDLAKKLDIPRCTKMALIHDMAEGLVGDLTPVDGVPKIEKSRREADTIDWVAKSLLGKVHGGIAGQDLKAVWQEYEDAETLESIFVHDVDKVELLLQMVEYERANDCQIDLSEFSWVAKKIKLDEMKQWAEDILQERTNLWAKYELSPRDPTAADTIQKQQDDYYDRGEKVQANGHAG